MIRTCTRLNTHSQQKYVSAVFFNAYLSLLFSKIPSIILRQTGKSVLTEFIRKKKKEQYLLLLQIIDTAQCDLYRFE